MDRALATPLGVMFGNASLVSGPRPLHERHVSAPTRRRGSKHLRARVEAIVMSVSEKAIGNFETGRSKLIRANHETLQRILERPGVEFTGGDGVRQRP
jgi:hypothetical protein